MYVCMYVHMYVCTVLTYNDDNYSAGVGQLKKEYVF